MRVVTVSEMRLVEDRAIEAGVSVEGLMESAGRAVAVAVRGEMTGAVAGRHVLILVGPGNNGGDGLVAARYLRRWGAEVHVHAPVGRRPTDRLWAEATAAGYAVASEAIDPSVSRLRMDTTRAEVIVDALLGTGHTRPLDGQIAIALQTVDGVLRGGTPPHARIVAVDVPTGVNADTGGVDPLTVPADLTVVLGILKRGHLTDVAASVCGRLTVVDIGIPPHLDDGIGIRLINAASVRAMLPDRAIGGHKGTFGRVLIVGGSRQYMGAPVLAARGAARIGAGLVTIAAPASISDHIATMMPEATHHPMRERGLADDDLTQTPGIADVAGASTAKLIGPGLGRGARARRLVSDGVMGLRPSAFASLVLDADALGILAELPDWALRLPSPTILTPHPGEMARLCGASTDEIQADRLGIAAARAVAWGATVVLKGAFTVVANPNGQIALSPFGTPALASAGTGDVLAGAITGLLAQGARPFDAACAAVYLHGLAGVLAAAANGDRLAGLLAGDVVDKLPLAMGLVRRGEPVPALA